MSDIKWIKVAIDMFEDNKIDFIRSLPEGDAIIVTWIQMLSLAGQSNSGGYLMVTDGIPYTEQLLSNKLKRQPVFLQFALETLTKLKMINVDDGPYHITKWEKHQNVDGMEKVRTDTAKRVANHRAKKKEQLKIGGGNVTVTLHGNANVTRCNATELELDLEIEKEKDTTTDDFKIVHDEFLKIHQMNQMRAKDYPLLTKLLEEGIAKETIIEVMNERYQLKKASGESVNGFSYYAEPIRARHRFGRRERKSSMPRQSAELTEERLDYFARLRESEDTI